MRFRITRRQSAVLLTVVLAVLAGCAGVANNATSAGNDASMNGGGGAKYMTGGSEHIGGVGSYYTASGERVIVREASIRIRVGNFSHAFFELRHIAERNGGYLGDRSQDSRGEWDTGSITVRVPPENFASARDAIASLGYVENEDVQVLDFTTQYRTITDRIGNLERRVRTLERLLNQTSDIEKVNRLRAELRDVREKLRSLHRQKASIQERVRFSTIHVEMHEPIDQKPPENYATAFGFTDAFMDAFYGGLTAVKFVIVLFGYAIPIGLALLPLGAFGVVLVGFWRRIRHYLDRFLAVDGRDAVTDSTVTETTNTDGETADKLDE